MMFRKTNEEIILDGLDDFIEKPLQEFKEKELEKGVNKVLTVLSKNPSAIMSIIKNHPYIPSTNLLEDLAEKMKKQGCLEKLGVLFDACLDELVGTCIYNIKDLERCIAAMPTYSDNMLKGILANDEYAKRVLECDGNPEGMLKIIGEKYPKYQDQFSDCYRKHFSVALASA